MLYCFPYDKSRTLCSICIDKRNKQRLERKREYHQRPEVKERMREYRQRPEVKERRRKYKLRKKAEREEE